MKADGWENLGEPTLEVSVAKLSQACRHRRIGAMGALLDQVH